MSYPRFFIGIVIILSLGFGNPVIHAQTKLQELKDQITDLESRLADAEEKQEKAYRVQMQLEEQEQKLASLERSEKYKVQVIEIRADISNIRTRIQSIVKEKNDLEQNLRIAKNMLTILQDAQIVTKQETSPKPAQPAKLEITPQQATIKRTPPSIQTSVTGKSAAWRIGNVQISDSFDDQERGDIRKVFTPGATLSRDDLIQTAYNLYNHTSMVLDLTVHTKNSDSADLEVLLRRREMAGGFMTWVPTVTFSEFRESYVRITVK